MTCRQGVRLWTMNLMTNVSSFGQRIEAIWRALVGHLNHLSATEIATSLDHPAMPSKLRQKSGEEKKDNDYE